MEDIGQRLKEFIEDKELSMISFSEKVGIQRSSLSHLFSGRNKPSIDLLLKIKKQFPEIDLDWLISGDKNTKDEDQLNTRLDPPNHNVTNVNNEELKTDNQIVEDSTGAVDLSNDKNATIERIVFFYKNGAFKEYKNS